MAEQRDKIMYDPESKVVQNAFRDYLEATRNCIGWKYEEQEPWAWAQLQERLANRRVRRLKSAA